MRLRKRKWVDPLINSDTKYIINNTFLYDDFVLEIGMGMGDFIIESAINNPNIQYIGLEKDRTCVGKVIRKLEEKKIENIKILLADASNLQELIKEESVSHLYLHFSDPWPKKHHHKRRLTYPTYLKEYSRILKKDGLITFKTDNLFLFEDTLEYIKESCFETVEFNRDYHKIFRDEPLTAYERKFKDQGININYLLLKKH